MVVTDKEKEILIRRFADKKLGELLIKMIKGFREWDLAKVLKEPSKSFNEESASMFHARGKIHGYDLIISEIERLIEIAQNEHPANQT